MNTNTPVATIDKLPPAIFDLHEGQKTSSPVTPAASRPLSSATLNGKPYIMGTPISEVGTYALTVTDVCGNSTTRHFEIIAPETSSNDPETMANGVHQELKRAFSIDTLPPTVRGLPPEGIPVFEPVTLHFSEPVTATLNGKPYIEGTPVAETGKYTLEVTDIAGNKLIKRFEIAPRN